MVGILITQLLAGNETYRNFWTSTYQTIDDTGMASEKRLDRTTRP